MSSGAREEINFWPGYVDALINVLLNLLFLVGVFTVGLVVLNMQAAMIQKEEAKQEIREALQGTQPAQQKKKVKELLDKLKPDPADFVTKTALQTITATLSAALAEGEKVYGSLNNGVSWTDLSASITNNTTVTWTGANLSGSNTLQLKVVDAAGNDGSTILRQSYVLDTMGPTTSATSVVMNRDNGTSSTDFITSVATQNLSGNLSAPLGSGESVWVSVNNGSTWKLATAGVGTSTWSLADVDLLAGGVLQVKVSDLAGNDSTVLTQSYTLDTTAPTSFLNTLVMSDDTAPNTTQNTDLVTKAAAQTLSGTLSAALSSGEVVYASIDNGLNWRMSADNGSSSTDFITNTANQNITGTLSANLGAGEAVYVSVDGGSSWRMATATVGSTAWSVSGVNLLNGTNNLQIKVTDAAGNNGTVKNQPYTLDTVVAQTAQLDLVNTILANNTNVTYKYGSFYRLITGGMDFSTYTSSASNVLLTGTQIRSAHAVSINTAFENDVVKNLYNGTVGWIGATDGKSEGRWRWLKNNDTSSDYEFFLTAFPTLNYQYSNWAGGTLVNSDSLDAARMNADGTWTHLSTTDTLTRGLAEIQGSNVLNNQIYASSATVRVSASEAGTAYLVSTAHSPVTVADILALDTSRWNSTNLAANNAFKLLSFENFSNGQTGWGIVPGASTTLYIPTGLTTNLGGEMNGFLGRIWDDTGKETIRKTYNFGAQYANQTVTIDFDMFVIDNWTTGSDSTFRVFVKGDLVNSNSYQLSGMAQDGGVDVGNLSTASNGGNVSGSEVKHHYTLTATLDANGDLVLGFGAKLTDNKKQQNSSWGVDNVLIATQPTTGSASLALTGLADGSYKLYTADAAGNLSAAALDEIAVCTTTPLVLDLNGDGVRTRSLAQGVLFDSNGDGTLKGSGWTDGTDGLLALDLNGDGRINDGAELFGNGTNVTGGKAADGYAALRQHDRNADGVIDAKDDVFAQLRVWVDANSDAVTDAGELKTLADVGVASLSLQAQTGTEKQNGNTLGLVSGWTGTDGQQHAMADVWFDSLPLDRMVASAGATQRVDLRNGSADTAQITLDQVLAVDQRFMVVTGEASDTVQVDMAQWQQTSVKTTTGGHTYNVWSSGSAHLLIDEQVQMQAIKSQALV